MMLQACLNRVRKKSENENIPYNEEEFCKELVSLKKAGIFSYHIHPKEHDGTDTLEKHYTEQAIKPFIKLKDVEVGISSSSLMGYSTTEKVNHIKSWNIKPDFVSVNWFEEDPDVLTKTLKAQNIAVEVGISDEVSFNKWFLSECSDYYKRVLLEIPPYKEPHSIKVETMKLYKQASKKIPKEDILLHGEDESCWPVLTFALQHNIPTRIGLEDTLTLSDHNPALRNIDLVNDVLKMKQTMK